MREFFPTPGIYQHYKGGFYTVYGTSIHTETGEVTVIYQDADGTWWNRPLDMWFDAIEVGPTTEQRFKKIKKPKRD